MIDIDFIRSVGQGTEAKWAKTTVERLGPGFTTPTSRSNNQTDGRESAWERPQRVEIDRITDRLRVTTVTRQDGSRFMVRSEKGRGKGVGGGLMVQMIELPVRSATRGVPGGQP